MTNVPEDDDDLKAAHELPVRAYLFSGAAGLLLLWLVLFEEYGTFALIPVLFGAVGLAVFLLPPTWHRLKAASLQKSARSMPYALLITVIAMEILFGEYRLRGTNFFEMSDLLTAAGLLAYFVGQFRLLGLRVNVVPTDTRLRWAGGHDAPEPRSPLSVTKTEWITLGIALPAALIAAEILWWWTASSRQWSPEVYDDPPLRFGMPVTAWRMMSLIWLCGVGTLLLRGVAGLLWTYRLTRDEARLYAQETLWRETRGEQRRVGHWLAWVRRKLARQSGRQA